MLRAYLYLYTQELFLERLVKPYEVSGIKFRLAACKAGALPPIPDYLIEPWSQFGFKEETLRKVGKEICPLQETSLGAFGEHN